MEALLFSPYSYIITRWCYIAIANLFIFYYCMMMICRFTKSTGHVMNVNVQNKSGLPTSNLYPLRISVVTSRRIGSGETNET